MYFPCEGVDCIGLDWIGFEEMKKEEGELGA
jgi:hypothetical protein